jgi:EAL domain-containing protein (putative c-di-GMP-specific phosphodiesterase class I)
VRSTIELSHELGMQMVAEGVEDQAAMDMLRDWGCDVAQGFHIARPMAAELLTLWLATSASERQSPPTELVPLSAGASTP